MLHGNGFGDGALAATFWPVQEDNGALVSVRGSYFLEVFEERRGQLKIAKRARRITNRRKRPQPFIDAPLFEKIVNNALLRAERTGEKIGFAIGRIGTGMNQRNAKQPGTGGKKDAHGESVFE